MDSLRVLVNELECFLVAVLIGLLILLHGKVDSLLIEVKKVEGVFETEDNFRAILRPEDVFEVLRNVYSSDYIKCLPIIESDEVLASDTEQSTSEDAVICCLSLECLEFGEVLVDLYHPVVAANSEGMSLCCVHRRPDQVSTIAKGSVLEFGVSIYNEVGIADSCEIPSCRRESHRLGKRLTVTKFFDVLGFHDFSILRCLVSS